MYIDIIPAYKCYEEEINLELYQAFSDLVVSICKDGPAVMRFRTQQDLRIWKTDFNTHGYFEPYQLRYPGEILERFAEKLGSDPRNLRALALALGHTVNIQSPEMFIGTQRVNFIQTVKRNAREDVYLQGALYLLETGEPHRRELLDALTQTEYSRTEEALFVLSLMDDLEEGYRKMHGQLARLFGPERTFDLSWNAGVLEWFIHLYEKEVKAYRGKGDLVLRTLVKLPYMNIKPGGKEFANLTAAGYSREEITLANALLLHTDRILNGLNTKGIAAEKIMASCCELLLNQTEDLPKPYYEYLAWVFKRYKHFEVKYEGYQGIKQAIQDRLTPSAPLTLLWLKRNWSNLEFYFDVFDARYDILAKELKPDTYQELFTEQLLRAKRAVSGRRWPSVRKWMRRYRKLTGENYCDTFQRWHVDDEEAFALLVEQGVLNLWQFFEKNRSQGKNKKEMELIKDYAMRVRSRRCFRFVRKLLEQYSFPELEKFFDGDLRFHKAFMDSDNRYHYQHEWYVSIQRPFLTTDEKRQLFDWIEMSWYLLEPGEYEEFLVGALRSTEIQALYGKEELAAVLRQLLAAGIQNFSINSLKAQLYTEKELEQERRKDEEQTAYKKQLKIAERREAQRKKLQETYNGTLESLSKFLSNFYLEEEQADAVKIAYEKILEWEVGSLSTCSSLEIQHFFRVCANLLKHEAGPKNEILDLARKMIGGGAA